MENTKQKRTSTERSGAIAVLVAILIPVLLLIVGFSVDLAYMQLTKTEIRVATDLAAKAASTVLADTGDLALARAAGKQVALSNKVAGQPLHLSDADFVFGNSTRAMNGKWVFTGGAAPTNAVQINASRLAGSTDGHVNLFFSGLLGGVGFEPTASATSGFINADVCLVLDRSSSMKLAVSDTAELMSGADPRACDTPWVDSRWVALDGAIDIFISKMNATLSQEKVGIVTFSSHFTNCSADIPNATVDRPLTVDMPDVTAAMATLGSTVWGGKTEISAGMELARGQLTGSDARPTAHKIMVVLTDGAFTNGQHPKIEAGLAAGENITVHTITFGGVPIEVRDKMAEAATDGGGRHYHAPDPATLEDVFTDIAGSIAILTE